MPVDWVSAQACPLDKKNSKEGCQAVRLSKSTLSKRWATVSSVRCWSGAFVVVQPGRMHLDNNMADLVSKPLFIKGSLLTWREQLGANARSPAKMLRTSARVQGAINKLHVWVPRLRHGDLRLCHQSYRDARVVLQCADGELAVKPGWWGSSRHHKRSGLLSRRVSSCGGLLASTGDIS